MQTIPVESEKEDTLVPNNWRPQFMRGISTATSVPGVYYEALKGSDGAMMRRWHAGWNWVHCANNLQKPFSHSRSRNYRPNSFRRLRRRAVNKNGDCNVIQKNLAKRRLRFLQDIFTTLVDSQWRWTLLAFALSFILSWLFFAVIWWLIAFTHGDLEPLHLPDFQGRFLFSVFAYLLSRALVSSSDLKGQTKQV